MDAEIETSWRNASGDASQLSPLWATHGKKLLKVASRVAKPEQVATLLDVAKESDPKAERTVLEHSALAGNVPLFDWMLQQRMKPKPEDLHNYWMRLYAIKGGVGIWKALLAYHHACVHWDIGEHGDALGQAVAAKDADLVEFLLEQGADVENANYVGMPVMATARAVRAGPEISQMLEAYGAED